MAIIVNGGTKILIQGITGKSGMQACRELLDYGMNVVSGVTPGKGGQEVFGVPVFDSIEHALKSKGLVDAAMVNVPPLLTLSAANQAIDAKIPLVHIFAEKVPVLDVSKILYKAQKNNVKVLGPNSVGAISPGAGKIGSIGGPNAKTTFTKGSVGVMSKSGGMCSELGFMITNAGFGQSTVVGVGGDLLVGTGFADVLLMFEDDVQTKLVVAFGEVGGSSEVEMAKLLKEGKFTKPLIVFMAGKFAEKLPKDTALGHAGAIVGLDYSMKEKVQYLKDCGVMVAETFEDIPQLIQNSI